MKKSTVGMIATILVVFVAGLSGLFIPFAGGVSALIHYMSYLPSTTLSIASSMATPLFALADGMGSCCVCIPIPLAFGAYALIQRASASALEEPFSQPGAEI